MNKKKGFLFFIFLMSFSFLSLYATDTLDIKLRFFEGTREGKSNFPQFVTSSYLQPTVTANLQSKYELSEEIKQIKRVFNLNEVNLITEVDQGWDPDKSDKIFHVFRLNSKRYLVNIIPASPIRKNQFRINVYEQTKKNKVSLLETDVILPKKNIAVFGFEDKKGKPYFLSFHVVRITGEVLAPPPPPPPPQPPHPPSNEELQFEKEAVRLKGDVKPKRIKKVDPVYPERARKEGVEGIVLLEAMTDEEGSVVHIRILKSKEELLSRAAVDAVKQWKYEPFIVKGKPCKVIFTVTVKFRLDGKKSKDFAKGAVNLRDEKKPKLLEKVEPVYPEIARESGVSGIVILEARTDKQGNVEAIRVLKSESTLLNQSAIDALKQWKYEPFILDGKPKKVVFTVTVKFALKDKEEDDFEKGAVKIEGEMDPPRIIKKFLPEYPEEARKAMIHGVVLLNVRTDEQGRVVKVKVLESPDSLLSEAAIETVKKWIYEPSLIKGKPRQVVFTVTVRFNLK